MREEINVKIEEAINANGAMEVEACVGVNEEHYKLSILVASIARAHRHINTCA